MLTLKGKILSSGVSSTDFMLVRCVILTVLAYGAMLISGDEMWPAALENNKTNKWYFWIRQISGNAAYLLNIFAMKYLPLGVTMILFNTAPFYSILLGSCINNTKIDGIQKLLMVLSFIGVIFIACSSIIS